MPDRDLSRLSGWGRNVRGTARVLEATDDDEVAELVRSAPPGGVLARGLGRAYGDAAINTGGTVVLGPHPSRPPLIHDGTAEVDAGASIGATLPHLLRHGWMLPVVPGTRHVTFGGAVAADIHGKNHHADSSLGAHIEAIELLGADGRPRCLHPEGPDSDLFWATVGGMGATGVIRRVRTRLRPVETSRIAARSSRLRRLSSLVAALTRPDRPTYQVAWVDGVHGSGDRRRSVLQEGEHASLDDLPAGTTDPLAVRWPRALPAPPAPVNPFRWGLPRVLNAGWWQRHRDVEREVVPLSAFFFPLDGIAHWNRVYGPAGFVQYQFVVPLAAGELVAAALDRLNRAGQPPTLVVVKTMGAATPGPLSFPMPGITAAIDLPDRGPRLRAVLRSLDDDVAAAGGRVYLAKDSTSSAEAVAGMYTGLEGWRKTCREADPHGIFRSDLTRRLRLT